MSKLKKGSILRNKKIQRMVGKLLKQGYTLRLTGPEERARFDRR